MKVFPPVLLLFLTACTLNSTDGPVETCADDPDCWKAGYESLLSSADFIAFETIEIEECVVTVSFAEDAEIRTPIENVPMYIVSRTGGAQTSFEQGSRIVLLNDDLRGVGDFRGGLIGITKYVEEEGPGTSTAINCNGREYSTGDNVWVITQMKEKPASGMTGSARVEGSQRPWQDVIDLALENARGENHLGRMGFSYWYPTEDVNLDPEEGEVRR